MNILIVSQYFHPENFRINELATVLVERGHKVTVLTGIPNYPEGRFFDGYGLFSRRRETWRGVEIVRAPLISRGTSRGLRLAANYLSFALFACLTGLLRIRGRFDAIFVFEVSPVTVGIPALFIKLIKRAPVLFWVLDLWPDTLSAVRVLRSPFLLSWVERLVRWIYRGCDRVLVQSQAFLPAVTRMGVDQHQVRYFPSWGDDVFSRTGRLDMALPPLPQGFRILFAGNIGLSQDFPAILDAAGRIRLVRPDIHWIIVGDGRMAVWVDEQVKARKLEQQVHLLGRHPLEAMPAFYAAADALLVSLRRDPIFAMTIPGKIQSYLASGRPILAMLDGEGARVVAEAGAGLCCPAENAAALAQVVLAMADKNEDERTTMGQRGRAYYDNHFDRDQLFVQLEHWLYETVDEYRARGRKTT